MSNCRYTLEQCVTAQRAGRINAAIEEGLTVSFAYEIASHLLEEETRAKRPQPDPFRQPDESPVRRKPCLVHREKVHIFADGVVMQCCTHDECFWGKPSPESGTVLKKHSDGMSAGTFYADVDARREPEIETSADDPQELLPPMLTVVAGEEIVEQDCEEDICIEQVIEDAATEDEDEEEWDDQ